jgi:hypothetical protein
MAGRPARKSFTERRKMALHEFREQVIEAQSQLSSVVLVADNDEEFEVPHPMLISDDAQKRLEIVQSGEDLDKEKDGRFVEPAKIGGKLAEPLTIRTARALLGDEQHKKFIAAGGHSNDITLAWQMLVAEQKELAEADPK